MLPQSMSGSIERIREELRSKGLERVTEDLLATAMPCVVLAEEFAGITMDELYDKCRKLNPIVDGKPMLNPFERWDRHLIDTLRPGASRIGGLPDLPPELSWPEHGGKKLPFVAQIDLATIPRFEGIPLPAEGWLFCFAGGVEFPLRHRVLVWKGPRTRLRRQAGPAKEEFLPDWDEYTVYSVVPVVEARLAVSLSFRFIGEDYAWRQQITMDEFNALSDVREDELQGAESSAEHNIAAQLYGNFSYPDESPTETARMIGLEGDDWTLLLEVQSVGDMLWSDAGMLVFLIRECDLKRDDFSRTCACINSS